MSNSKDSLPVTAPTNGDVRELFRVLPVEDDNIFSNVNLTSLTRTFNSLPYESLPRPDDIPGSTLFGEFSEAIQPPSSPVSSILSFSEEVTQHTIPDDDLWQTADVESPTSRKVVNWESFGASRNNFPSNLNPFITEQKPEVFDEQLRRHMNHIYSPNESGTVVDEGVFRECLLAVSTGRESSLFHWNDRLGCFEAIIPKLRIFGISPDAAQSVITQMCRRGTIFRRLRDVSENILRSPLKYGSIPVSFARSILSTVHFWQSQIQSSYAPTTQGILTLDSTFRDVDESLFELARLCSCDSHIQRYKQIPSPAIGGELLTNLYDTALTFDYPTPSPLRALSLALLKSTSSVFLDLLTYWIGFQAPARGFSDVKEWYNLDTCQEFFVQRINAVDIATCKTMVEFNSLFQFDERSVPTFIGRNIALKLFEMGSGLRLLWRCKPDHPLCDVFDVSRRSNEQLALRWLFSWEELHAAVAMMETYQLKMWDSMERYEKSPQQPRGNFFISHAVKNDLPATGLFESKEAAEKMLSASMETMSLPLETAEKDDFITNFESFRKSFQSSTAIPLLSLIAQNSFSPAIEIQANLIQHALLSLFFNSLDLRKNLQTLHSYFLFGNGLFVTSLLEALFEDFDEEDVRSGGQPGLGLGIGKVKDKTSWPPNGAKVGLVLRNVLAETFGDEGDGSISFAYRDLTEDQFEKVKNPLGLQALDFLQLLYKPTFPLDAIITPSILERYDRIFLFLLRLFRMQYISHQLFRDAAARTSYAQGINPLAQRFRIEAHHFITAICGYMFNVSITGNWHTFQSQLSTIHTSLENRGSVASISEVRELHARTLDIMTHCCLLRRRQQPILTLLYGTFEPVMLFAKTSRLYAQREQRVWSRMREEMEDNTRILYTQFSKRAGMFVRVIEQLERKGVGNRGSWEGDEKGYEGGWFMDLLVRLDGTYFDRN